MTISVKELTWGERRVYVSVYWPVIVSAYGYNTYTYAGANFFPFNPGLGSFFPALAIHDRLVLVPTGQTETLEQLGPVETEAPGMSGRDVLEVDFRNSDALEAAIRDAGQRIRDELWRNFRAYSRLSRGDMSSLLRIAEDLGVSPTLLGDTIRSRTTDIAGAYEGVTCDVEPTEITCGRWEKLTLHIRAPSSQPRGTVTVAVSGPAQLLPPRNRVDLSGVESVTLPISVKADDIGDFPLEIALVAEDEGLLPDSIPPMHVWLKSVPGPE